jgi:hypothetical protein
VTPKPEVFFTVGLEVGGSEGAMVGSAALARCRTSTMSGSLRVERRMVEGWSNCQGGERQVDDAKAELLSAGVGPDGCCSSSNGYL